MVESTLPGQQTSSTKPVDGTDKSAQGDKPASNDHLLQPFLSQSTDGTRARNGAAQLDTTPTDSTIVVDMSILFDLQGAHGHMGAEDKANLLKELKDKTKDHSVSIVLESLTADGKDVPGASLSTSKEPYGAQMIVLRDGQEFDISNGKSKGLKGDLQDVLDFALKNQPSKNVALAINAHGIGDQGILGGTQENKGRENGRMTASELAGTIKSSLNKAGRDKLDVVDMDSCLMAEMGVLHSMSGVTKQLVASERTEKVKATPEAPATEQVDGQNLNAWISKVIDNPKMTDAQVAHEIVADANQGYRGDVQGADSLVSFDLSHVDEFSDLMNKLGKALSDDSKIPGNADQINKSIDETENFAAAQQYGPPMSSKEAKYDVKQFMANLQFRLKAKLINDPDGELKQAMENVNHYVDDRSKLITTVHLPYESDRNNLFGPNKQTSTGLSIYLPNSDVRENPSYVKADMDRLQSTETGTANGDWNTFLGSLIKPIHHLGSP